MGSVARVWVAVAWVAVIGTIGVRADAATSDSKAAPASEAGKGRLDINVTDVLGHDLHARVELRAPGAGKPVAIEVPKGHVEAVAPVGAYKAYIYVYSLQVPVLVDVQDVAVKEKEPAFLVLNLLEGSAGNRTLLDFDKDRDFAIDRVELKCGTNPEDPCSIPGRDPIPYDQRVLAKEARWYRGELHAHSAYGAGKESVKELVSRAEKAGLDFLAITDRNTIAACLDPEFKSDSVVLIPALEWGSDERGVALLYGPRTFPEFVDSIPQAQALVDLVQGQGGFFAIAHPCFPNAPWQWGLGYVNGIEVWCRDWRGVPPMTLDQLDEDWKERREGKLIHSIAFAAATTDCSANGQASIFYDCELVRGLKAAVIAGSSTGSPAVPMGSPVTYVYASEKSVRGLLDGMRRGRTFVSESLKGPKIRFGVLVGNDEKSEVPEGGIIPLQVPATLVVSVTGAKGDELQVLLNGQPLLSKNIENNGFTVRIPHTPENYAVYRVRVVRKSTKDGFGATNVLAMTSPIYAQDLPINDPKIKALQKQKKRETAAIKERALPADPGQGEIKPKWKF